MLEKAAINIVDKKVDDKALGSENIVDVCVKSETTNSDTKFRQPETRTEFTSFFLHFVAPRPFYKSYSYV